MNRSRNGSLITMGMFVFLLASCAPPKQITREAEAEPEVTDYGELDISDKEFTSVPELATVYFDFDESALTMTARETLKNNAEYLANNPSYEIRVEGHCDERGTTEYNLALGQRRAMAVRQYYISLGVTPSRLGTISYGEERPVDYGHNEAAWSQNRRAETKVRRPQQASFE